MEMKIIMERRKAEEIKASMVEYLPFNQRESIYGDRGWCISSR